MRRAIGLQHVAFENLGSLEPALRQARFDITMLQAGIDDLTVIDPIESDLLVRRGPIGAYETENYPHLRDEAALIATRPSAHRPTLGLRLGAQLMATALNWENENAVASVDPYTVGSFCHGLRR